MKHPLRNWAVATYILFWFFIALIGVALLVFKASDSVVSVMKTASAWAPTITVLLLFKFLFPSRSIGEVLKERFLCRFDLSIALVAIVIQAVIAILALLATQISSNEVLNPLFFKPAKEFLPILPTLIFSGAIGEELGWRGYMLGEFEKKHSSLFAGILTGVIWGFWHLPLWLASGIGGIALLTYIVSFMVAIISFSVFITAFYSMNRNLFLPMVLHFGFNFWVNLQAADVNNYLIWIAIAYALAAILLGIVNPRRSLRA